MPPPVKVRAPQPLGPVPSSSPEPRRLGTPTETRAPVGNAAVAAAMGGARPGAWTGQMMLAGQNLVGNLAVAGAAAKKPAPPLRKTAAPPAGKPDVKTDEPKERPDKGGKKEVSGPRSPGTDPKFQALKKDVNAKKKTVGASHPPAAAEAGAAQEAAEAPADDQEARGKAAHAEDMDAAQPKEFDKQEFIKAVKKAVADKAPKNLDEADKFGESGKAEEVKTEVQGKVGEGKDASAKEIADTTAATPEPARDAKQVVPMAADKVPGKPGTPDPNQAAPDTLPASATDLSAGPAKVDQQMAAADVTDKQLSYDNSHEQGFDTAVKDKKTMEAHSAAAPVKLRGDEKGELNQVKAVAATRGAATMTGIHATRVATGHRVGTGKQGAKTTDEDKRKEVTGILQKVFDQTKSDVEKILTDLDKKVDDEFTTKEKRARDRFTAEHEEGMRRYKDERYGGWTGWARWTKDLFAGLPEEANRIYERARDHYLTAMDQIITEIADTVDRELKHAKERIAQGRKDLKAAVDQLPKDLKAIGRQAAQDFEGKFDELTDLVNDKGTELVDTLATKYSDAVKAVDDEIAKEKEKNKGLVAKAAAAIGGVLKTILELGRMLMGVLQKAASAVPLILRNPIGFLGNLVTGVGGGLKLFLRNAGRHLEQGVIAWLLGTGVTGGLQLPATFDVLGILLMLAALLGLSWANLRTRLTRKVNPKAVAAAEAGVHAVPLVVAAKKRGVAGLWDDLKARVGDLKKDLVKNLVSFLLPTIVIAGITWIVSLFNPASAFIRACKMIIDIIRFIVTQGRQIIEFVNTVLDAVIAIAKGGTGGVPALVEKALARSIPVLIGALAAILGVGGIANKVKDVFQKLARPVNKAIDWVIDKISGLLKKLWSKIKPKPRKPRKPKRPKRRRDRKKDRRSDKKNQRALDAAVREATRLLNKESATVESVRRGLPAIKRRHRLTLIRLESLSEGAYDIEVAINPRKRTRPRTWFPYKLDRAEGRVHVTRLPGAVDTLRPVRIPMRGNDFITGFVINMPATPGEVKGDSASRYLDQAWAGGNPSNRKLAAARTAVVIGINTFESLDPAKDAAGRKRVGDAVRRVKVPDRLLAAVFGFLWTPRWRHTVERRAAPLNEVRQAWARLPKAQQDAAVGRNERHWRDERKLPYGVFREEIMVSTYTERAVQHLAKVNKQVYVVSQDPDTGVKTHDGKGFLRVYDEILRDVRTDPVLVIGGVHFEDFDWGPLANSREAQLTLLASRLDRAMREAIGRVYPQLLYPTEQSMLVKVWERDTSRRIQLLFQDTQYLAILRAGQGRLWGIGAPEGRRIGEELGGRHGRSVAYRPEASLSTSALPEDPTRGYLVTPALVRQFAAGNARFPDLRPHPAYAAFMQSQSVIGAFKLASAFAQTHEISQATRAILRDAIFEEVETVAKLMANNPNLTVHSAKIQQRLRVLDRHVRKLLSAVATGDPTKDVIEAAHRVAREMITAMTGDELKVHWYELRKLLRDIMRNRPEGRR